VTFSCYRRQQHLGSPAIPELLERSLEQMRVRYDFFVNGYVVMPEHVPLPVSEPLGFRILPEGLRQGVYPKKPKPCPI